ncbi:ASCH domain-containing protein [Armatimonas sp.]|uniref:ASCH domain-containing protein n=1 Tax=Armatimonas sp. TaxID=1872638 RepID=UPI00286A724A|nr:ASCH domain-containing protein [Armatimonas sp.]
MTAQIAASRDARVRQDFPVGVSKEAEMFALNFYNELYGDALRKGRKSATIRLGDKTGKYQSGMLVWVTLGQRFGRRYKLFTAILDSVEVKAIKDLTPRDLQRENPEFRTKEDVIALLSRVYDRPVVEESLITIIYFSPVDEYGLDGI